ncbi:MAG: hypothetical protein QM784_09885 [Polyangiaceae bacterium]
MTTLLHCVARIDHEVHDDLFELALIRHHHAEIMGEPSFDGDVVANEATQHLFDVGHHLIEIECPGLQDLFATERQQLPDEDSRPLASLSYFIDVGAEGVLGRVSSIKKPE